MKTAFDHITDKQLSSREVEALTIGIDRYSYIYTSDDHGLRIALLIQIMLYWKSWIGPPITIYNVSHPSFDGNHRVRAVRFIAAHYNLQIQMPIRFDPACSAIP